MTPADWRLDETREWISRAEKDLRAADLCATELPAESLIHCQQPAEKYLKAFLTWHQIPFRKTRELRDLSQACIQVDPALEDTLASAYCLSKYAWLFRYPGAPYEPDADEAVEGRVLADAVRVAIRRGLPAAV